MLGEYYEASGFVVVNEWRRGTESARADVAVGADAQGRRRPPHPLPRCTAYVRNPDASSGCAIAVISAWLGHASKAFTMQTYVHSQPEALSDSGAEFRASCDKP